jgi:hypothetical protein
MIVAVTADGTMIATSLPEFMGLMTRMRAEIETLAYT